MAVKEVPVCDNPPPRGFEQLRPCCLVPDHNGRCRFWKQEREGSKHGIHTYEIDGGVGTGLKMKAIQMLDMKGTESTDDEVAALIQYMELVKP